MHLCPTEIVALSAAWAVWRTFWSNVPHRLRTWWGYTPPPTMSPAWRRRSWRLP
jgi:hypothetical protein